MEATKLANRLLQDHSAEGSSFTVGFDVFDDLDLLAQRFREAGCIVEIDRLKRILHITPPTARPAT